MDVPSPSSLLTSMVHRTKKIDFSFYLKGSEFTHKQTDSIHLADRHSAFLRNTLATMASWSCCTTRCYRQWRDLHPTSLQWPSNHCIQRATWIGGIPLTIVESACASVEGIFPSRWCFVWRSSCEKPNAMAEGKCESTVVLYYQE